MISIDDGLLADTHWLVLRRSLQIKPNDDARGTVIIAMDRTDSYRLRREREQLQRCP